MNVSAPAPAAQRSVLVFLIVGMLIRLLAVNQPLVNAHLFRQTQTALMTQGLMEPGWQLSAVATWRGDLPARLVLELPAYNYLVIAVHKVLGNLDISGKVVSVLLWAAGFLVLQQIWRRCLNPRQAFWANFLFVFAPLSVFFGQAFMPEMLIQLLAFSFIVMLLRYDERPEPARFLAAAAVGLLGMLVKGPEISHLYLIVAILVLKHKGLAAVKVPAFWIALIVTGIVLKAWSHLIDVVNSAYFPDWSSRAILTNFIGSFQSRFSPAGYLKISMYLALFVLTPVGLPFLAMGLWRLIRTKPWKIAMWWVLSIAFFFFFWSGPVGRGQSYYNLPALGPCALLFGWGVDWLLSDRIRSERLRRFATASLIVAIVPFLVLGNLYLFRPDPVVLESTRWIREHTSPDDLILLKANHREDAVEYPALAPFPYYGQRRFWIYSPGVPEEERQRALRTSRYAIVTSPPERTSRLDMWRRKIKKQVFKPEDIQPTLLSAGFNPVYTNSSFIVYSNRSMMIPE
jgi:hypothetical protein